MLSGSHPGVFAHAEPAVPAFRAPRSRGRALVVARQVCARALPMCERLRPNPSGLPRRVDSSTPDATDAAALHRKAAQSPFVSELVPEALRETLISDTSSGHETCLLFMRAAGASHIRPFLGRPRLVLWRG